VSQTAQTKRSVLRMAVDECSVNYGLHPRSLGCSGFPLLYRLDLCCGPSLLDLMLQPASVTIYYETEGLTIRRIEEGMVEMGLGIHGEPGAYRRQYTDVDSLVAEVTFSRTSLSRHASCTSLYDCNANADALLNNVGICESRMVELCRASQRM